MVKEKHILDPFAGHVICCLGGGGGHPLPWMGGTALCCLQTIVKLSNTNTILDRKPDSNLVYFSR